MRFLGIGDTCDLGALYLRLLKEGHEVKVSIAEPLAHGTLAGMVERVSAWRAQLDWVKEAGSDGVILFENVAHGRGLVQDELRSQGFNVIGGSAFGDRLENDRAYAQEILAELGLRTASVREFSDFRSASDYIEQNPARYVLKFNGADFTSSDNYVGWSPLGLDTKAVLQAKLAQATDKDATFILMAHIEGVEMGVGAYFDGEKFIGKACLDWEHKRFFPGDLGELTGEMGTVVTYERTNTFFQKTLLKMGELLRRHNYCGYINLNTIVNEDGIWPLEFTCRFGYPGFAILTPLQRTPWGDLFKAMVTRKGGFATGPGFCVGIVLTTPPFPYNRKLVDENVGAPIFFDSPLDDAEMAHLHYGEVGLAGGQLVTAGCYGWTMVVTGAGDSIAAAAQGSLDLARKVHVANVRYRQDIGANLMARDFARVERLGLLDERA
jgi:phosphoribosylamine--glycine ligase